MHLKLDSTSPVPLFHQIAEALRYLLATGRLTRGQSLPTLRDAARDWGVHLHTVRRAYAELAAQGLVHSQGARGTWVAAIAPGSHDDVDEFVSRFVREAWERHEIEPAQLARRVLDSTRPATCPPIVYVVECNDVQCDAHVAQLEERWAIDARPWCLTRAGEPPAGQIVATLFHYNEIRRRWPGRLREIRFATIGPDPRLVEQIRPSPKGRRTLHVIEREESMAQSISADLSQLFPAERFRLEPRVVARPERVLRDDRSRVPLLFSPRTWQTLDEGQRQHPRAHLVCYSVPPDELEALGREHGWSPAPQTSLV